MASAFEVPSVGTFVPPPAPPCCAVSSSRTQLANPRARPENGGYPQPKTALSASSPALPPYSRATSKRLRNAFSTKTRPTHTPRYHKPPKSPKSEGGYVGVDCRQPLFALLLRMVVRGGAVPPMVWRRLACIARNPARPRRAGVPMPLAPASLRGQWTPRAVRACAGPSFGPLPVGVGLAVIG